MARAQSLLQGIVHVIDCLQVPKERGERPEQLRQEVQSRQSRRVQRQVYSNLQVAILLEETTRVVDLSQ